MQMREHTRRIAIVCQPWDVVGPRSGNSIPIITYQLARHLARDWHITIYGRRRSGQNRREFDGKHIEFKRFTIFQKPRALVEVILGIFACYFKICIPYVFSYFYHFCYAIRVANSIRASKCEIIYIHNFLQFASVIRLFNPLARICLHMHGEWLTEFASAATERRLRTVDLILGCSDHITERIRARFPEMAGRCHTVYNGVDPTLFYPAQDSGLENDRAQHILYVGRLIPEKGVHILIKAFKNLVPIRPTVRLDVVGAADAPKYIYGRTDLSDPPMLGIQPFYGTTLFGMIRRQLILRNQSYIRDLAAETAGDNRITFHGPVTHTDTIKFYRRAMIAVVPSVSHEPFGIPTVEAMACGVPVVAALSGGIPEIVEHGRTGLLVPRGDARELARAIGQLLDDPARARAMGNAGRQRVLERFSWDASVRRIAELLNDLFESRPIRAPCVDLIARGESPM